MKKFTLSILLMGCLAVPLSLSAQFTYRFQQYLLYSSSFNPAGVVDYDGFRIQLANQQQFSQLPDGAQTLLFSTQYKLKNSPFGLGLLINSDNISYERALNLGVQIAAALVDFDDQRLALGVELGFWSMNADYTQAKTDVPETGLASGELVFQQADFDANVGLHYFWQSEQTIFQADIATRNLPSAFLGEADPSDPYRLRIPMRLMTTVRLRFGLNEQIALEPGFLMTANVIPQNDPSGLSYSLLKPGSFQGQLRAYIDLAKTGELWVSGGWTFGGGILFGLGLALDGPGLQLYGVGGPSSTLGFSHEEGLAYYKPHMEGGPGVSCLAEHMGDVSTRFQALSSKPKRAKLSPPSMVDLNTMEISYLYPDGQFDDFGLNDLPGQRNLTDYAITISQELEACSEANGYGLERVELVVKLQDGVNSLGSPTLGKYNERTLPPTITYLVNGKTHRLQVQQGSLTQGEVLVLKLYKLQQYYKARFPELAVELRLETDQRSQDDLFVIQQHLVYKKLK